MPEFDPALIERINTAIRSVRIRFGPNALAILGSGGTVPLSQGESWHMALAVAQELYGEEPDWQPCPDSEFVDYGPQCTKRAGHNLCSFQEHPTDPKEIH